MKPTAADAIREHVILASILQDTAADLPPSVAHVLDYAPEGWESPECGRIAAAVRRARSNGAPCDMVSIAKHLAPEHVGELMQIANDPASGLPLGLAEMEAQTLLAQLQSRRVTATLGEAWQASREHPDKAPTIAAAAREALASLDGDTAGQADTARPWVEAGQVASDADILIGPGRWITRGAGVLLVGPTGCGKSTWTATAAFTWALGRECLGMVPTAPLKSLVFQAEDDAGDLAAMADAILAELRPTEAELALIRQNVLVVTESAATGTEFLRRRVAPALHRHAPDLAWLNPLSTYFGSDLNDQREVAGFFRNTLNPLLLQHRCGCFTVHHCPKPSKERADWAGGQLAYAGAGSADLANWAREVITLRETSPGLFEMHLAKRWRKVGWTDSENRPTATRLIAHDRTGSQVWHDATPDVLAEMGATPYSDAALVGLVPEAGIDRAELVRKVADTFGLTERTAAKYVGDARRERRRNVNGTAQRYALLAETTRPRRDVYPDKPEGRAVVWLTPNPSVNEKR